MERDGKAEEQWKISRISVLQVPVGVSIIGMNSGTRRNELGEGSGQEVDAWNLNYGGFVGSDKVSDMTWKWVARISCRAWLVEERNSGGQGVGRPIYIRIKIANSLDRSCVLQSHSGHSEVGAKVVKQGVGMTQVSVDDTNNEGLGVIADEIPRRGILWRRGGECNFI